MVVPKPTATKFEPGTPPPAPFPVDAGEKGLGRSEAASGHAIISEYGAKFLKGSGVCPGIGIGTALVVRHIGSEPKQETIDPDHVSAELERLEVAIRGAREDLAALALNSRELGNEALVAETQSTIIADPEFTRPIEQLIREQHMAAPSAVHTAIGELIEKFAQSDMLGRMIPDFRDVRDRLLRRLGSAVDGGGLDTISEPVCLVVDRLSPTEALGLKGKPVLGVVTGDSGMNDHTVVICRRLGIPLVRAVPTAVVDIASGAPVVVDGFDGKVYPQPPDPVLGHFRERAARFALGERRLSLETLSPTRDGVAVAIIGNAGSLLETESLRERQVRGIGLFRSEELQLCGRTPVSEDSLFDTYLEVLRSMYPHPVTIRTSDLGSDKLPAWIEDFFADKVHPVANPALDCRGIRFALGPVRELFKSELRAILRASVVGNARVLLPMINDAGEFRQALELIDEVKNQLRRENVPFDERLPIGAMIETASAVLEAPKILRRADFLSIGTNDLTQYALAVDRQSSLIGHAYSPHHPSVLNLIRETVRAADRAGKPVSICGDMASMKIYAPFIVGLGLRHISVNESVAEQVHHAISQCDSRECAVLVAEAIELEDADQSEELLERFLERSLAPRA
jgi:phosphotransferase system enzyme I (PtsI)